VERQLRQLTRYHYSKLAAVLTFVCAPGCLHQADLHQQAPQGLVSFGSTEACEPQPQSTTRYYYGVAPTGIPVSYRITRDSRSHYRLALNLHFRAEREEAIEKMSMRAKECLRLAEPHLLGPGGETLEIQIDNSDRQLRVLGIIQVRELDEEQRRGFRENSLEWETKMSCGKILHEILHHFGLPDEYEESKFGCRAVGPAESPMVNGDLAWQTVVEGKSELWQFQPKNSFWASAQTAAIPSVSEAETLSEDCSFTSRMGELLEELKEVDAPTSTNTLLSTTSTTSTTTTTTTVTTVSSSLPEAPVAAKKSLLQPAHFRALVQPGCSSANSAYLECARLSREPSPFGLCPRDVPEVCRSRKDWLK
jgi:hypothetical protein